MPDETNKAMKISIHPLLRAGTFARHDLGPVIVFLSTRSYERERGAGHIVTLYFISIHPLLRAGTIPNSAQSFLVIFLSTRSYEREHPRQALSSGNSISIHPLLRAGTVNYPYLIFNTHFYPPALTSGNPFIPNCHTYIQFLSTRSYERELPSNSIFSFMIFLSTRSYEREPIYE